MLHTITYTEAPRYETTATCSCGWTYTDPNFPWLRGYARQHAENGNKA